MKRWHDDVHTMLKQRKIWTSHGYDLTGKHHRNLGRFRKRHAFDCGNARCHTCHSDKLLNYKKMEEEIADLDMRDQLQELEEIEKENEAA